jgi:hypothetical protein
MKSVWEQFSELNEYLLKNEVIYLVVDIDNTLLETTYAATVNQDLFKSKIVPSSINIFAKQDEDQYYKDLDLLQDEVSPDYPNENIIEWINSTDLPVIIVTMRKTLSSKVANVLKKRVNNIESIETRKNWKTRLEMLPLFAAFIDDHPKVVSTNNIVIVSDMPWNRNIGSKKPRIEPLHPLED